MKCTVYDLEVMGSSLNRAELGVCKYFSKSYLILNCKAVDTKRNRALVVINCTLVIIYSIVILDVFAVKMHHKLISMFFSL